MYNLLYVRSIKNTLQDYHYKNWFANLEKIKIIYYYQINQQNIKEKQKLNKKLIQKMESQQSKQNQIKQVEFLQEIFSKSSFSKKWQLKYGTQKSWSTSQKYQDERTLKISARPQNEEEVKELNEIEKKIIEQGLSYKDVYEQFQEIEIDRGLAVGEKFPHYTKVLSVSDESEGEIKHQEGEVILLDVWATWCGPCQRPMQHNQDMLTKNEEKWAGKVRIIAVSVDDNRSDVLDRINQRNWNKITHFKLNGWDANHPIIKDFSIQGIPFVALVDKQGVINYTGHPSSVNLEERINSLLEDKSVNNAKQQMTSEQYKLSKEFIKSKLGEYFASQDQKEVEFTFDIQVSKETSLKDGQKVKTYSEPSITVVADKKQVESYQKLKNYLNQSLQNVTLKYANEQIRDIKSELKKDMDALSKIYEKFNIKSIENKHCVKLSLQLKKGKLQFSRVDWFNQHKKLYLKNEDPQNVTVSAEEQQGFAINKYRSGQYADYLQKMFNKGIQTTETECQKPKSQEDIYRKYKDILSDKSLLELNFDFKVNYNCNLQVYIKRRRVFDCKGQMKYKYYSQPVCKYVIREKDVENFQKEVLDKLFAKFDKNEIIFKPEILKTAKIEEGKNCKQCNSELTLPYYFNYFQKEHYCLACGDKRDTQYKTLQQFAVPHNLVMITTNEKAILDDVDEYKLGKNVQPKVDQEIEFEFYYCCNGCAQGDKDTRFICLNCRPGPYRDGGFTDFCQDCIKKQVLDKDEQFMKKIQQNDTEHNFNHLYLKIITPIGQYRDY
ncbi:hypothetical protein ABPG74_001280 [Tetrahymena malaccensis]